MERNRRLWLRTGWILVTGLGACFASAQLVFEGLSPTLVKAKVDCQVTGRLAETDVVFTYKNPGLPENSQVEFVYQVPAQTTVAGFSYWFKGQEIKAKVVEKERAREVYNKLTWRNVDPGLLEMVGKRTFTGRIFPIQPDQDIQIKFHLVSTLAEGELAIPFDRQAVELESVDQKVTLNTETRRLFSSLKEEPVVKDGKTVISAKWDNKPKTTGFTLSILPKEELVAETASDGSFVLVVPDPETKSRPKMLSGASDVVVEKDQPYGWVVTGRVGGSVKSLTLLHQGKKRTVLVRRGKTLGKKMISVPFGSARINRATRSNQVRQATALSLRYGVPSRFTSWLAIPDEEVKRLREMEAQEKVGDLAYDASEIAKRRGFKNPGVLVLRNRVAQMDKKTNLKLLQAFDSRLASEAFYIFQGSLQDALKAKQPNLTKWAQGVKAKSYPAIYAPLIRNLVQSAKQEQIQRGLDALISSNVRYSDKWATSKIDAPRYRAAESKHKLLETMVAEPKFKPEMVREVRTLLFWEERRLKFVDESAIPRNKRENALDSKIKEVVLLVGADRDLVFRDVMKDFSNRDRMQLADELLENELKENGPGSERQKKLTAAWIKSKPDYTPYYFWRYPREFKPESIATRILEANNPAQERTKILDELRPREAIFACKVETMVDRFIKSAIQQADWQYQYSLATPNAVMDRLKEQEAKRAKLFTALGIAPTPPTLSPDLSDRDRYVVAKNLKNVGPEEMEKLREAVVRANRRGTDIGELQAESLDLTFTLKMLEEKYADPKQNGEFLLAKQRATELRLQIGDPLLILNAPKGIQRAYAFLPTGEVKDFEWNEQRQRWQLRFDVPEYLKEGRYVVPVVIIGKDGSTEKRDLSFSVDLTPPGVKWSLVNGALEVQTDLDVARIELALSTGEEISLARIKPGLWRAEIPSGATARCLVVTDKAHNQSIMRIGGAQ